jgi:hypothetical protein
MGVDADTLKRQMDAFAQAYGDPTSPSYGNATQSYRVAMGHPPTLTDNAATRGGGRYVKMAYVQEKVAALQQSLREYTGMSPMQFAKHCFDQEERLMKMAAADVKGAAVAAARYADMAGKSMGLFVNIHKDITPPKPLALPKTKEELSTMMQGLRQLMALSEANPLPPGLTAGEGEEIPEAEFEVEHAEGTEDQGPAATPQAAG